VSVSQESVIAVFLYYYIVLAIIGLVAVVIFLGLAVFVHRRRVRRRARNMVGATSTNYNNV
jgi:hypothetical protein